MIAGGLTLLTGFTGVTSITFALSSLFFARDMDTLIASPVAPRAILLSRLLGQLALGIAVGTAIGGPPTLAYAVHRHAVPAVVLILLVVASLVVLPLVAGTVLTLLAVRLMPARYVRDAGGLVVTLVVFAVTAVNLLIRGTEAFTSGRPGVLDFSRYGRGAPDAGWTPTGLAARSVVAGLDGDLARALVSALPLVMAAVLLPLAACVGCERAFVVGYQRNAAASRGRARPRRAGGVARRLPRWPWLTLMVKDLRVIRRDASLLGQLLLPLVLFGFYMSRPGARGDLDATTLPSWYGTSLTAAFASLFAAAGIALRGIGGEGGTMWLLRVSPLRTRQLLAAKFLSGTVVAAPFGVLLLLVGELRAHAAPLSLPGPVLRLVVIIAGLVGLATGMGALRPRLNWTDPRRSVGIGVNVLFLAAGSVYLALGFVILGVPYALHVTGQGPHLVADLVLTLLAAGTGAAALAVGGARLRRIEI